MIIWFQVFLSNTNNSNTVIWFQETNHDDNLKQTIIERLWVALEYDQPTYNLLI